MRTITTYLLTYEHNGFGAGPGWDYGCKVSHKLFRNAVDAAKWLDTHPEYTPRKLLAWDNSIQAYVTIKDYAK